MAALVVLLSLVQLAIPAEPNPPVEGAKITREELRERMGAPDQVARQIYYRRVREQWIYERPKPGTLIELDCARGEKPRVLRILSPLPRSLRINPSP